MYTPFEWAGLNYDIHDCNLDSMIIVSPNWEVDFVFLKKPNELIGYFDGFNRVWPMSFTEIELIELT